MAEAPSALIATLSPRRDATFQLFVFPYAGGGASAYREWTDRIPAHIEVVSVTLPGRVTSANTASFERWPELVSSVTDGIQSACDGRPFAFFGHSFGALVAYEACRELRRRKLALPTCLVASAHRAPQWSGPHTAGSMDELPQDKFLQLVRTWGFIPEHLLTDSDSTRLMLSALRADLRLDRTYPYQPDAALPIRIVACGGSDDHTVPPSALDAWRTAVDTAGGGQFCLESFPGGHFYTISALPQLLERIDAHLSETLTCVPPSLVRGAQVPEDWIEGQSVVERVRAQCARTPERTALIDADRIWTYEQLRWASDLLSCQLQQMNIAKGEVVGLLVPHSAEYLLAIVAILNVGASVCLLERHWPAEMLEEFCQTCNVRAIVTAPSERQKIPASYQDGVNCLVLDAGWQASSIPGAAPPTRFEPVRVRGSDIAFISMTSGSTGRPKAVLTTHRGCVHSFLARQEIHPYEPHEREGLNVFFAWECLRSILHGQIAQVIPDATLLDPPALLRFLREQRVTRLTVTPSLLEAILDYPGIGQSIADQTAHMYGWFLMGEVVPLRLVRKAARLFPAGVRLINAYSTWETLDVTHALLLPTERVGAGSVAIAGRLVPGYALAVVDSSGRAAPRGVVGEVLIGGPGLAPGYLADEVRTAARFIATPTELSGVGVARLYRSGDLGRILPDGQLEVLGRADSTVKIRGFKVSIDHIERILESVPGIARAVVNPELDPETSQPIALLAYLLGEDGAPSDAILTRVRQRAREQLSPHERPTDFIALSALPLQQGESRKIDRRRLPRPIRPGQLQASAPRHEASAPREAASALRAGASSLEHELTAIWREVLNVEQVEPTDEFFENGGTSLLAVKLVGIVRERLQLSLSVADLYEDSTLEALLIRLGRTAQLPVQEGPRQLAL